MEVDSDNVIISLCVWYWGVSIKWAEVIMLDRVEISCIHVILYTSITQQEEDELYFPLSFRWTSKNNTPRDVYPGVAVVLDNLVYCRTPDRVCQYNPVTDTWTVLPEIPMSSFITTVLDGQLIVVGGIDKGSKVRPVPVDIIMAWDSSSQQWIQPYPPLPTALFRFGCNGYKHYLIISGGVNASGTSTSAVYILDTHAQQWYEAPPLPFEGNTARTVIIGETLYITLLTHGMITSSKSITSVSLPALIASAISDKSHHDLTIWTALPDLPFYVSTLFSIGKMLVTIGGRLEGSPSSVFERMKLKSSKLCAHIHVFNPRSNQWVKVGELPETVFDCACIMLPSGKLLVAGGKTDTDERSHSVYVASILTRSSLENTACTS